MNYRILFDILGFCDSLNQFITKKFKFTPRYNHYINPMTKTLVISGTRQTIFFLDWLYDNCKIKLNRKYNKFIEFLCDHNKRKNLKQNGGSVLDIEPIIKKYI